MLEIRIRYLSDRIEPLRYIDGKSDWIDLRSAADMVIGAGEYVMIPLGVAMQLPEGYEAYVVPRSSTFRNYGLLQANSFGVVDESYSGNDDEWKFPVYATRDTEIHVNDRICQFRIIRHQPEFTFVPCDRLDGENRGGFGSTGKN